MIIANHVVSPELVTFLIMFLTTALQVRNDEKAATEALTEDDIKAINALSKVIRNYKLFFGFSELL